MIKQVSTVWSIHKCDGTELVKEEEGVAMEFPLTFGAGVLLSESASTDLGLGLEEDLRITCVGLIRGQAMNVC